MPLAKYIQVKNDETAPMFLTCFVCLDKTNRLHLALIQLKWLCEAVKQPKRKHKTESVGQTAWRPYGPTGAMRHDNNDDDVEQFAISEKAKTCLSIN